MISEEAAAFLWDASQAAERIFRFAARRSYEHYREDEMLRSAVERQFQIIGEALRGLQRIDAALAAQIPDLRQIIAFRNVLVHDYTAIDHRIIWDAMQAELPQLRRVLSDLLKRAPKA